MYISVEYYRDSAPKVTPWASESEFISAQKESRVWARKCPLPAQIRTLSQALEFRAWDMEAVKATFSQEVQQ